MKRLEVDSERLYEGLLNIYLHAYIYHVAMGAPDNHELPPILSTTPFEELACHRQEYLSQPLIEQLTYLTLLREQIRQKHPNVMEIPLLGNSTDAPIPLSWPLNCNQLTDIS